MIAVGIFVVAVVVVVLTILGHIPLILGWPAIGILVAVGIGYLMRRSGPAPPS
jgi:hypothetical protein